MTVKATVNGERHDVAAGSTVADLLATLGVANAGIAVAVNACVVRRAAFGDYHLCDGDAVEIVRAVAGG